MSQPSQTSLSMLQGMRDEDPEQWARFTRLFAPLIYEWCRRNGVQQQDSADIVQEVFRAVAECIGEFRRNNNSSPFHRWLWGITRHKIQDHFRKLYQRPLATGGSTAQAQMNQVPLELPEEWEDGEIQKDQQALFHRALELLKTDFQEPTWKAFWRVTVEEIPASVVAEELGMTQGAVYNAKYKVLKRLREEMQDLL